MHIYKIIQLSDILLTESHIMPRANFATLGCNTLRKHKGINIFKIPKAKS